MGWEESSMSFFICKAKFLCHLYSKRTWVSQIAADEDSVARVFSKLKRDRRKVFLNLISPFMSSFQHLVLDPTQ